MNKFKDVSASNSYALISDIHGEYQTLLTLIKQIPENHEVIFLGDLVDRGPDSCAVIQYAIDNKIRCVMGNHDHLMVDYYDTLQGKPSEYDRDVWFYNGGLKTIRSYRLNKGNGGNIEQGKLLDACQSDIFKNHIEFLRKQPSYIQIGNLHLSHTGHGGEENMDNPLFSQVWSRSFRFPSDGLFRVFGHTQRPEALIEETFAAIDTGAAYKDHGNMTAFLYPSKKTIVQKTID